MWEKGGGCMWTVVIPTSKCEKRWGYTCFWLSSVYIFGFSTLSTWRGRSRDRSGRCITERAPCICPRSPTSTWPGQRLRRVRVSSIHITTSVPLLRGHPDERPTPPKRPFNIVNIKLFNITADKGLPSWKTTFMMQKGWPLQQKCLQLVWVNRLAYNLSRKLSPYKYIEMTVII